jgi:hypothetical protein
MGWLTLVAIAAAALAPPAPAGAGELPSSEDVVRAWRGRMDGVHFTADITLEIDRGAAAPSEERRISVWRDDDGRRERLMARFEAPADLRGLGLLYLENAAGLNDYFLYQPATRRVRRIAEALAREDVYGVDLEYLGFGVAQIEETEVESVAASSVGGRALVRLVERAVRPNPRFDARTLWLDPASWLPVRVEHVRGGRSVLRGETLAVEVVQGIATPMRTRFERPLQGEAVVMRVDRIDYAAPIPEIFFSTLTLAKEK